MKEINTKIGVELSANKVAELLTQMSLQTRVVDESTLKVCVIMHVTSQVVIPPTRHDILHECDIAEDVGVAYGFNNLVQRLPEVSIFRF